MIGKSAWNKGKQIVEREARICPNCGAVFEVIVTSIQKYCCRKCFHEDRKGKDHISLEGKKRLSKANSANMKRLWQNPGYSERQLKAIIKGWKTKPNVPEKFLIKLLQELFPDQWKFVGDGQFILAGKNPDFVNVNGQKKIIEHFGVYHHGKGVTGVPNEQHEQERINLFAQYGYQTLVIWGHELENIELLTKKVIQFNSKGTLANEEITPDMELLPSSAK